MNSAILFQGNFSKMDVTCRYISVSSRKIDPTIERKAKLRWQEILKEAKAKGKKIWDQPVYRLERFEVDLGKCVLEFSTIPFSLRTALMSYSDEISNKGTEYFPMATYSSTFVETKNGDLVYCEKSGRYMVNRKYTYIGGVFNRSEGNNEKVDLFRESLKEVIEELDINRSDIRLFRLLGAFKSETQNVGFVFYCKLNLTSNKLLKKFADRVDDELNNLIIVGKDKAYHMGVDIIGKEVEMVEIFKNNCL